jgi:hypothetical protein
VKPAPASAPAQKVTKVAAIPAASSQKVSKQAKEDDWEEF